MEQQSLGLADMMGALKRRWPIIAALSIVGLIIGSAVAAILPPTYLSTARILVESQQIPSSLARSTITALAPERIRLIEQRLMTRRNLLEIAETFAIFEGQNLSPTEIVDSMRARIAFEMEAIGAQGRRDNVTSTALSISFTGDSPAQVARVATNLVSRVLEQNILQRSTQATGTMSFFSGEVDRLSRELSTIEDRILLFRNQNRDASPDSLEFRRTELSKLQDQLFGRESVSVALREQRRQIEEALARGETAAVAGAPRSRTEEELDRLRRQLVQQRAIYAETHPAIRALQSRIGALEASMPASLSPGAATGTAPAGTPPDVARQIELLDKQIQLVDSQLEADRRRAADLQLSIERTPEVERTLNALTRQRDGTQVQYQDAVLKRAEAETGERLEINQQAERFEVIEQPQQPAEPVSPNRPLIMIGGLGAGAVLGGALMMLLEILNRSVRTARDLERRAGMRPIVTVPYIFTARELRRRRLVLRTSVIVLALITPAALIAVDQFYTPLTLLLERGAEATRLADVVRLVSRRIGE